ncbi:hypothetical protein ACLI1A_11690 [Flavobacterium sp. RHBU_3]|uniref:hypothetical protein n=1 Tax=Flavobacterium sp. RHBU_3 TaxID=3391184 RepID=UPI0039848ED7
MMLTAWHASSQNGIKKDSVVISKEIAKKVLIDLADYDRLRENKVEENLDRCVEIQKQKDTLIIYMSRQSELYEETLSITEKQIKVREQQLVASRKRNCLLYGGAGFVVGIVLGLLLAQ